MFPYAPGVMTMLQGLYSLLWIVILMDVWSPTLDLRNLPEWTAPQILLLLAASFTITFAVGVVMHTLSRNLFRRSKDRWALEVLTSPTVWERLGDLESPGPTGAPTLEEVHAAKDFQRVRKAGEFMHALDYVILTRAPHLHHSIQLYREQYQLARGFILPSLLFAVVLPFWDPVPAGHVGNFPLISVQLFFLGILFAGVSMYAFKERSFRYAAARIRGFLSLQGDERKASRASSTQMAAVG